MTFEVRGDTVVRKYEKPINFTFSVATHKTLISTIARILSLLCVLPEKQDVKLPEQDSHRKDTRHYATESFEARNTEDSALYYPTNAQYIIRIKNQNYKIFKSTPTLFGSQRIHHQGALYSAWLKITRILEHF